MSGKLLLDLAMKLSADTAELRRNVEQGKQSLQSMEQRSQNMGATITKSFAAVTAAFYGVRGAMNQFNDMINSTMTGADRLRRTQDGLNGVMEQFNRSVMMGNFDGFINQMNDAYRAAARYSDIMDELGKKQMAFALEDKSVAADIFRLDQIIYNDENSPEQIMAALADKRNVFLDLAEKKQESYIQRLEEFKNKLAVQFGDNSAVDQTMEYFRNYYDFDEARNQAQEYFDIFDEIAKLQASQASRGAVTGGAGVRVMGNDNTVDVDYSGQIKRLQSDAEQLYSSLDGMGKWLIDNQAAIEIATPQIDEIMDVQGMMQDLDLSIEQHLAKIQREERRLRLRLNVEVDEPEVVINEENPKKALPDLSGMENLMMPMKGISELTPTVQGADSPFNQIKEQMEEAQNAMHSMEGIVQSAAGNIVDAFFNMADGVDVSVGSIIKSILKMTIMQFISQGIGALFNPVAAGANMLQGVSPVGQQSSFLPQNFSVPGMADGGIFYGPQVVQVAEYSGAQYDPEIIGRASQIRQILGFGNQGNQPTDIALNAAISADYIHLSNSRSKRRRNIVE
jgi:hypothetical protein